MNNGEAALHAVHGQQGEYGEILLVNHHGMMESNWIIWLEPDYSVKLGFFCVSGISISKMEMDQGFLM